MGRTLHYSLFGSEQIPWDTRRELELARRMLDWHMSWTCESFGLEMFDGLEIMYSDSTYKDHKPWMPRVGWGCIKVADDEWNAHLVLTYLRWASSKLPSVTVRVRDEGGYILGGYVTIQRGVLALDLAAVAR
jgi:hypothetical protein